MKLNCITGLLFAAALISVCVPQCSADSLSCAGSILCKGLAASDCSAAQRFIVAGNTYQTGQSATETGVCSGHCGIFVSGSACSFTGLQMMEAIMALQNHGCKKCGIDTFVNGCEIKIDYVTGCR